MHKTTSSEPAVAQQHHNHVGPKQRRISMSHHYSACATHTHTHTLSSLRFIAVIKGLFEEGKDLVPIHIWLLECCGLLPRINPLSSPEPQIRLPSTQDQLKSSSETANDRCVCFCSFCSPCGLYTEWPQCCSLRKERNSEWSSSASCSVARCYGVGLRHLRTYDPRCVNSTGIPTSVDCA